MGIYEAKFIRLKKGVPNFWNINPERVYVVQDTKYNAGERFLILRNKKGKLRQYYEDLFEEVKFEDTIENPVIKDLMKTWMADDKEESHKAYDTLKERETEWQKEIPFKKGVRVMFIRGTETDKYKDRIFICSSDVKFTSMFNGVIRLAGLYGYHEIKKLEVVSKKKQDGNKKQDYLEKT